LTSKNALMQLPWEQPQSYMARRATQDHKDSAVSAEPNLKDLAESPGRIPRLRSS